MAVTITGIELGAGALWGIVALIVCLLTVGTSKVLYQTVFSPLGVYAAAWGGLIFLYQMDWVIGFQFIAVSPLAWFVVIASVVVFAFGSILGTGLVSERMGAAYNDSFNLEHLPDRLPPILYLFAFLGIIGVLVKWIILLEMFGSVSNAVANVGTLRAQAVSGEFSYPVVTRILVLFLFPPLLFVTLLYRKNNRYLGLIFGLLFILFLDDLSIAARGHTVFGFTIVAMGYLLTGLADPEINLRKSVAKIAVATIGLLLSVNVIFAIRSGFDAGFYGYLMATFRTIYRYAAGPLPAFSWVLSKESLSGYPGAYTFGGLYRILNYLTSPVLAIEPFSRPPKPDAQIPNGFNTFPHLWALYSDFGFVGALTALFTFGGLSGYVYSRFLTNPNLMTHVASVMMLLFAVWSPRDITTFWVSFWVLLSLALVVAYTVDLKPLNVSGPDGAPRTK